MKKLIAIVLLGLGLLPLSAQTDFRAITFDEAVAQAKQENKKVFIDFYTDWCGPCKMMARDVFPQKAVGDYFNANFVCIKLDAEKEGKDLAQVYGVKAYPTFLVLDTDKKVLLDIKGSSNGEDFIRRVKNGLNPEMTPERMKARYEAGDREPEFIKTYVFQLYMNKQNVEGNAVVKDYFASLSDAQKLAADNFFLYERYILENDGPMARFLLAHCDEFEDSVKEKAQERCRLLYNSQFISYLSGAMFKDKQYDAQEYARLKQKLQSLKTDEKNYEPLFALVECYAQGDREAYLDLFESSISVLEVSDRDLILMNVTRLFDDRKDLYPRICKIIRSQLATMRPNSIMLMGSLLSTLEGKR